MKIKSFFLLSVLFIGFALITPLKSNASDNEGPITVPCDNVLIDYKKGWFTTNCSYYPGKTCLVRCKGPKTPDVKIK